MTPKNFHAVFFKLIAQIRKNEGDGTGKRANAAPVAQTKRLFDTSDSKTNYNAKLSKFYKAMDLAG